MNLSYRSHEQFEELCALAAIGELDISEFRELEIHLLDCPDCRALYSDFTRISARDLGVWATQRDTEEIATVGVELLNEDVLLAQLTERLRRAKESRSAPVLPQSEYRRSDSARRAHVWRWIRSPVPAYAALGLVVGAALALGGYRVGTARQVASLARLQSQLAEANSQDLAKAQPLRAALDTRTSDRADLLRSLGEAQARYSGLLTREQTLQAKLNASAAYVDQLGQDLQTARTVNGEQTKAQEETSQKLQVALREVDESRQTQVEAVERAQEQEKVIADLNSRLDAAANAPLASNTEAKQLMGARDLHIVDVFDVAGNGKTSRTYGRVFFVEKKLLVFYAFDLQDKRHNRAAAGFQAWGYRQPNLSKPENLGLFYVDDASLNRWVLKVDNPRVLEHVDAVFVTLEPPEGSRVPSGRKLLYANLAGTPNHP